ncbi:MAG: hypothetical protein K2O56_04575 [Muribaculaceae bacterium]|nr:hypothetical protein [Muribaculaceae bacterium]
MSLAARADKVSVDSLMDQLEDVIARREVFLSAKEKRLADLYAALKSEKDEHRRFYLLNDLYGEYHPFNSDSAYNVSLRQEALAKRIGDPVLVTNARMNRANILCTTGMYSETLAIMDTMRFCMLPGYLHPYYYHIKRTLYGLLADHAAFPAEKREYRLKTELYRDSIMAVNDPSSLPYVLTKADALNNSGNPAEAVRVLKGYLDGKDISVHEKAICAWTLSESYGLLGERDAQKEQLLISSISDLQSTVREYVSLRELALLLYEDGDLNRAYDFMKIALEDASACNARLRIIELNDSYPKINAVYIDTVQKQKRELKKTIIIITVLTLLLVAMMAYLLKQMRRISRARKEIEEAYGRLNELTDKLKSSNEKLSEANNAIAENSELKEVYIGRYMDQCLGYIEKFDSYRKSVGKLLNSGKLEELKKLVKSTSMTDDELKLFYDSFDKTFLNLFPTFVEDFNALLLPEEAIVPKKAGTLNTELRIFALIRLGITDSDKIAKFLRYSLTTIYNYRTRVRNKARGDRNRLESEIQKIGR